MKLIILEYLSLLKESKELDWLIPDLLLSMGIEPISHSQVGVRQFGVDVASVGLYKDANTLLLFTIKQGDLGRQDWDSNEQAIRQSLEEIKDVYLESHVRPEHASFKKVIILCTGGELKQEIQQNWKGYITRNTIPGELEYEFWGGDRLAILIEEFMFNEHIVPNNHRSSIRKALALLTEPNYDLKDYYNVLRSLLFETEFGEFTSPSEIKKAKKSLTTANLLLNVLFSWAKNENNLKPAILAGERTVLLAWEFLRKNDLFSKSSLMKVFKQIYKTFTQIYLEYFQKIQPYCFIKNGLNGYSRNSILENLNLFEQLGIICSVGLLKFFKADFEEVNDSQIEFPDIVLALKSLIENHPILLSPYFDNHIIEISQAIFILAYFEEFEFLKWWLEETINHITFGYLHMGKYFPIQSDSFDDLVSLNVSNSIPKENLMQISTLLPILAQWSCILGLNETYELIKDCVEKVFQKTTMQIWYPDSSTEEFIYSCNSAFKSGFSEAPITIPAEIEGMKAKIHKVQQNTVKFETFSAVKNFFPILPSVSSRHFRMPFLPCYWQQELFNREEKNPIANKN